MKRATLIGAVLCTIFACFLDFDVSPPPKNCKTFAKIDGEEFCGNVSWILSFYSHEHQQLTLSSSGEKGHLYIVIPDCPGIGTYPLDDYEAEWNPAESPHTFYSYEGSLTIDSLTANEARGTFHFKGAPYGEPHVEVTDGRFEKVPVH